MTRCPRAFSFGRRERAGRQQADGAVALVLVVHRPLPDGRRLRVQLDRAGQHAFLDRQARLDCGQHGARDLVEERVDVRLALAGDRRFIRHDHLRDREIVLLGVLAQLLHGGEGILGRIFLRRLVALPFDEAAAHRVVLELVDRLVAGHELAGHGVGVGKLALGRVIDDVSKRQVERLATQGHRIGLLGLGDHLVEEQWVDRGGFHAKQPGKRRALRAVSLAGRTEAAEQVHLQPGGLGQLVGRQLGTALVEIIGDAHRPDRVRARRARSHLVELVGQDHHRALGGFDHIQVRRKRPSEFRT